MNTNFDNGKLSKSLSTALKPETAECAPAAETHGFFSGIATGKEKEELGSFADWLSDELLGLAKQLKTVEPKGTWESLGSETDIAEENGYNVKKRPQVRVSFEVRRKVLLQKLFQTSYLTKEASEDSRDQRSSNTTTYGVTRKEVDVGVQAIIPVKDMVSQTLFSRKVDAAIQAEPILVDACIKSLTLPRTEEPAMSAFFNKVLPRMLHCLLQNYEVAIYQDDFSLFNEDDAIVCSRDDTVLIEKGNYTHTTMKDLRVSSISWQSSRHKNDCVCIASIARHNLEQRIEAERRCEMAVNLVWDFADPMHPRALLEAPVEIQVLQFNPLKPNLIAGGAINGQVFLWDLDLIGATTVTILRPENDSMQEPNMSSQGDSAAAREIPPMSMSVKGRKIERDGDVLVPRLQPVQSSRVELSHRRPIHAIQWLPNGLECAFDGRQTVTQEGRQFSSVSDDGYIFIWDIRPEYLPAEKLRKMKHQGRIGGDEFPWVPLLRYQMARPGGCGDLMGFCFHLDGVVPNGVPSYMLCCGTTFGEVAFCSLATPDERREFVTSTEHARVVKQLSRGHAGPVYNVQRHPKLSDVYLSCGDFHFKIWRVGLDLPILTSPRHDMPVTCACWAPSRAGVVVVGTMDGKIQVWDLLDRSTEPVLVHQLVQDAITVIAFKPVPAKLPIRYMQYVAIGTSVGSFHWYALPRTLSRGPSGEQRQLRTMLEREVRRVYYYRWRWMERERERDRYGVAPPKMLDTTNLVLSSAGEKKKEIAEVFDDDFYAYDIARDSEFLEKVRQSLPEAEMMDMSDFDGECDANIESNK